MRFATTKRKGIWKGRAFWYSIHKWRGYTKIYTSAKQTIYNGV